MSWVDNKDVYEKLAKSIDPSIKLVTKDSWVWSVIGVLIHIITFGCMPKWRFLTQFATTLGPIQAYPRQYPKLSKRLLVHEARHTRQARWFGFGIHPWVGLPLIGVFYLLLPVPLLLAWFRYRLEVDADFASYRYMLANGYDARQVRIRAERFADLVSGASYVWSWPRPLARRGFAKAAERAIAEHLTGTKR